MTTTWVAPALAAIWASSQPPSMAFRSATMGTPGNSARRARILFIPSEMTRGVPASNQSTPERMAIRAVSRALGMEVKSSEICTMIFIVTEPVRISCPNQNRNVPALNFCPETLWFRAGGSGGFENTRALKVRRHHIRNHPEYRRRLRLIVPVQTVYVDDQSGIQL